MFFEHFIPEKNACEIDLSLKGIFKTKYTVLFQLHKMHT